jgi:hypothetical protein
MCRRKQLTVVLLSILIAGCHGASTSSQNHAATAEGSTPQAVGPSAASGGVGSGAALRVSFTEAATSADARTRAPTNPDRVEFDRGRLRELPSVPTSGTRKQASTPGFTTPQTSRIRPCVVALFPCPFESFDSAQACEEYRERMLRKIQKDRERSEEPTFAFDYKIKMFTYADCVSSHDRRIAEGS